MRVEVEQVVAVETGRWWRRRMAQQHEHVEVGTPLSVALGTPIQSQCSIGIDGYSGTTVDLSYRGLPANQPESYRNFVAIWQSTVVPWRVPPLKQVFIPDNAESGTLVMDGLQITNSNYILAYSVGPALSDICASAVLGIGGQLGRTDAVAVSLNGVGTTSLSVHYVTLSGYLPATNQNRIGLWTGLVSPYDPPPCLATVAVPQDVNEGDVAINGIAVTIDTTYTLVYFMGTAQTTAAAILSFTTAR
jgi:hypothetical protein